MESYFLTRPIGQLCQVKKVRDEVQKYVNFKLNGRNAEIEEKMILLII